MKLIKLPIIWSDEYTEEMASLGLFVEPKEDDLEIGEVYINIDHIVSLHEDSKSNTIILTNESAYKIPMQISRVLVLMNATFLSSN